MKEPRSHCVAMATGFHHKIQKGPKTFGKDKVSSSNLDSSSMKSLEPQRVEGFLFFVSNGLILKFVTDLLP